jgi:hypothetical protein
MADPMHRLPEHTGPLTDDEKAFLRLVKRSPATFGNWRCVSKALNRSPGSTLINAPNYWMPSSSKRKCISASLTPP